MINIRDYDFNNAKERAEYLMGVSFELSTGIFNRKRFSDGLSERDRWEGAVERTYWKLKG